MSPLVFIPCCALLLAGPPGPAADVRIVFWYDRSRPLDTFRYQVYDLGRGQYTPAVDDWLGLLHRDYPAYAAYARDFDLSRGPEDTRAHRTGAAIVREFLAVGLEHGYDFSGVPPGAGAPPIALRALHALPRLRLAPAPNLQPPSFGQAPFPIPYPRPHP